MYDSPAGFVVEAFRVLNSKELHDVHNEPKLGIISAHGVENERKWFRLHSDVQRGRFGKHILSKVFHFIKVSFPVL